MRVEDLKRVLSSMPDDVEITADECEIKKVTATIDKSGNIIVVNLEI